MKVGRIVVHDEPKRYKHTSSSQYWQENLLGVEEPITPFWNRASMKVATSNKLLSLINRGALDGYVESARVRRRNNQTEHLGTITKVLRTLEEALDEDMNELYPFRVTWDKTDIWPAGGSFNYPQEDLIVVSVPYPPKGEAKNETVSNLSNPC